MAAVEHAPELVPWVAKIGDQETRFSAIETIARYWLRTAPDAANRWLAETDLPVERRNRLRPFNPADYR